MNKKIFWIVLILTIAAFFRFYNLKLIPPGLYPDEAMNGNNALEALENKEFKVYYPENNGREGLFINIQALFLALIQKNEPWVLRLPSAIFGFLTILGIYFLCLELFKKIKENDLKYSSSKNFPPSKTGLNFNEKIALLSAFILSTSFWHINFSRIGFRAIMAPFLSVWAFYFLLKSLNNNKKLPALFAGIFFGLGFYTYIAYRIMPLLLIPLFWHYFQNYKLENKIKNFYKIWVIFLAVTFFIALPIGLYYLKNPQDFFGRTSQISIFESQSPFKDLIINIIKTLAMFNFVGDFNWRHNLAGQPELNILVGILFLYGVYALSKIKKEEIIFINWFIWGWFFLAMLPVIISNEGLPHALRAILMLPPVILISSFGGIILYEKLIFLSEISKNPKKQKIIYLLALILLLTVVINTYFDYFVLWAKNKNAFDAFSSNYVELGKKINSLPKEIPKYIIVEAGGVKVRGLPMPSQTVMFITNTFLSEKQKEKNVFYILPEDKDKIPPGAEIFIIN